MHAVAERVPCAWWTWRCDGETHPIRVYSSGPVMLWRGFDIVDALQLEFTGTILDAGVEVAGWVDDDGTPEPFISTPAARELAAGRPDFLGFIDRIVENTTALAADAPRRSLRPDLDHQVADAREGNYILLEAAQILSRDPGIDVGRETLFDALRELRWVHRDRDGANVPTPSAIAAGYLARNDVWVPKSRIAYNKIRVTPDGIRELHRLLGGAVALDLDAQPTPTLVEVQ